MKEAPVKCTRVFTHSPDALAKYSQIQTQLQFHSLSKRNHYLNISFVENDLEGGGLGGKLGG